jgi:outer membrane lipoprotein SlyB
MQKLLFGAIALAILGAPIATSLNVKAEDTTVIKRDGGFGDRTTVIKKEDRPVVDEKKVIIHHD